MYKYILFDLDGTLTDPFEGITRSVQYALNAFGVKDEPLEALKRFIGPPLKASFMEFYGFDSDTAVAVVEKYRERFADIGIYENRLFDGIPQMLEKLKKTGHVLAIASSKPTVYVERILQHFHIRQYFDHVMGSELDGRRTDKKEVVQAVLSDLHIEKNSREAIMVGDRFHDVQGARACGLDCVGVTFGYGGKDELVQAGAAAVVDTVDALYHFLAF